MNKKMNNKGFSLVELIIVIAIMAVLVGVLAPAYTRYVESSRKSRDVSAVDSVLTVVETSMIDYNARNNKGVTVVISVPNEGTAITITSVMTIEATPVAVPTLKKEIEDVMGTYTMAGSWEKADGTTAGTGTITATVDGGTVVFTNSAVGTVSERIEEYSAAIGNRISATPAPAGS